MQTDKLDYKLPTELIAQQPSTVRSESKLLVMERSSGKLLDKRFSELGQFLRPGDCLVLNDTKVLQARFFARRGTGGKLEGLFLEQDERGSWEVMLKGAGRVKLGETVYLRGRDGQDVCTAEVVARSGNGRWTLSVKNSGRAEEVLGRIGFAPLPPYIKRDDDLEQARVDKQRYQTVYARQIGAVAAPTAGLHFTTELLEQLEEKGVHLAYVTLHVGTGTFKPIKTKTLAEHKMHGERFTLDSHNAQVINSTKRQNGRIIAVGTTSVRVLETTDATGLVKAQTGTTELFIVPGYTFKMVDGMVTNFHLPRSTLLALVAAFVGLDEILAAYRYAIEKRYRFYSYGDAMLIV